MQKKSGIMKSGLDAMPVFLLDDLLKGIHIFRNLKRPCQNSGCRTLPAEMFGGSDFLA